MSARKSSAKSAKKPARSAGKTGLTKATDNLLAGYEEFLSDLKQRIRSVQIKASLVVNTELIALYWEIGKRIVEKQEKAGWGDEIIVRLGNDLTNEFPGIQGFSRTNLYRMRALYQAWRHQSEFVPQLVGQIPWGHNLLQRDRFVEKTLQFINPLFMLVLAFIQHMHSEAIIGEIFGKLLPRDFVSDLVKIAGQ